MALTTIPVELVTLDDGVTISTADNDAQLILVSTDADANVSPLMQFYRNSGTPADNDQMGRIEFNGRNDNSQDVNYATIVSQILDASDGTEDGRFAINTMVAGTSQSRIDIRASETVINNESIDLDFRVESNGSANMLFVDGGNDEVVVQRASSGATATAGSVLIVEDDDNTELSILGGSSSVLAINFGHSGDNDEGKITFNTTAGSEDLQLVSSKEITLDAGGDITFDADGGDVNFKDGGTLYGFMAKSSNDLYLGNNISDGDVLIRGNDGGSNITAVTFDMSDAGAATFNNGITLSDGNLVFASGHGIDFNATANSSGSLGGELFDDYEEGTWTPVMISGGSTNPTGGGALSPSGRYTKIGGRCFVTFYVGRSYTNSPNGGIQISGLPYTINASTNGYYTGSCATYNVTFGDSGSPFLIPNAGNTTFALYSANSGGTWAEMTWQSHSSSGGTYVTGMFSYAV